MRPVKAQILNHRFTGRFEGIQGDVLGLVVLSVVISVPVLRQRWMNASRCVLK